MKKLMGRTMMKMKDNRKNGRKALKGFTLVEIIVVLVILAILAAAMIPALTGYIDKAKGRTAEAEGRNVLTAAQTLTSEAYGMGKTMESSSPDKGGDPKYKYDDILALADVKPKTKTGETPDPNNHAEITSLTIENGKKVTNMVYTTRDGKFTVTWNAANGTLTAEPVSSGS